MFYARIVYNILSSQKHMYRHLLNNNNNNNTNTALHDEYYFNTLREPTNFPPSFEPKHINQQQIDVTRNELRLIHQRQMLFAACKYRPSMNS
jgi:hypothetical protein